MNPHTSISEAIMYMFTRNVGPAYPVIDEATFVIQLVLDDI
ncbi:hypothetical protein [Burkholderia cenocepacia]|nr:hypothetical protein [Burkholderia cenocepacia]